MTFPHPSIFFPTMAKRIGQSLMLLCTLVLLCGGQATWCDVFGLFGIETHHHVGSATPQFGPVELDHHGEVPCHHEDIPCNGDCSLDLAEATLPETVSLDSVTLPIEPPIWKIAEGMEIRTSVSPTATLLLARDHSPPPGTSPPLLGRFLI